MAAAVALGFYIVHHRVKAPVTESTLRNSLGRQLPGPVTECRPEGFHRWECGVEDPGFSGSTAYRVDVRRDGSCWIATRRLNGTETPMPRRVTGCVRQWGF